MKQAFVILLSFLLASKVESQIFKKLGDKIKRDAEWRIRSKADQQVSKGLDSIIEAPKKIIKKKEKTNNPDSLGSTQKNNAIQKGNSNITAAATPSPDNNDMDPQDGFITVSLSANRIFAGGSITITGTSVKAKKFTDVEITVSGPSTKDIKSIALDANGKFISLWNAADNTGEFTVTAKSSDKKSQQTAHFTVYALPQLSGWCNENIDLTNAAYDKLKDAAAKVKDQISTKNKADLDAKLNDVKESMEEVLKLFNDLNTAGKETAQLIKSAKNIPPNLAANLSDLNNNLANNASQMKAIAKMTEHEPQDNTICEYLAMLSEACAAFQTITNFWSKSVHTILLNITIDKAIPSGVSAMNKATVNVPAPADFLLKEPAKIFATSKLDAASLSTKLGKAGLAADLAQFATDVLLKIYCGVFSGSFTHDYHIDHRNAKGQIWWSYGFSAKAVLSLRYPKKNISATVIKMKGNLEGNATQFSFFEDIEKEDGFFEGTKGKIEVVPIHTFIPLSVSAATSERDVMGFGAVARGLATPAYFNIPVDAEYDVDAGKIKIFINPALVDFTDLVANQFVFLLVGADLLPYVKKMNFPIEKIQKTIASVVSKTNEFIMDKDARGNLNFSGKGNKHIGSPSAPREHDLNFTITAKKE